MNAYELAQELEWLQDEYYYVKESADMLRQQADRIAALELQLFKVTNRTIATRKKLSKVKKEKIRAYDNGYEDGQKALTTISDEELWEIWDARIFTNPVGFYRTAIKKASEE